MGRFSRFVKMTNDKALQKLQDSTILILGLGGVGGYAVEALARSGVGHFILIDFDVIDETNINRQIIALTSTIGQKKTEAFKTRILDINPCCQVDCYDMFYSDENKDNIFLGKIDYVIDACDTISSKKVLILECLKRKIPLISSMGTGNKFDPSKLYIDDIRKTSNDPLAKILRKWVKNEGIKDKIKVLCSHEVPKKINSHKPGSSAFVPSSAGLLMASYVVCDIIKEIK